MSALLAAERPIGRIMGEPGAMGHQDSRGEATGARLVCAHFSDLHYSAERLEEADRCFGYAIDHAIAAGVDVAVISGDATHHALESHSPALLALAKRLRKLLDHCPVLMLQGTFSHEPPGAVKLFQLLGGRFPLQVADRLQQTALLEDRSWSASRGWRFERPPSGTRALFSCVPTLNRAALVAQFPDQPDVLPAPHIASLLAGYAPGHDAARSAGVPTLLVSHGTVNGATNEHGILMADTDHEFSTSALFSANADACLLGHIHMHQSWERNGRTIAYPGSIGRFHFGELGEKGYLLWNIAPGVATATLQPTPARRTVDLLFDGAPSVTAIREAAAGGALQGAHVRVRWEIGEQENASIDRNALAAALAGAASIKFEGRVIPVLQARAPGISRLRELSAQVAAWAEAAGTEPAGLLECLNALQAESAQDIALRILAPPADHGMAQTDTGTGATSGKSGRIGAHERPQTHPGNVPDANLICKPATRCATVATISATEAPAPRTARPPAATADTPAEAQHVSTRRNGIRGVGRDSAHEPGAASGRSASGLDNQPKELQGATS